MNDQELSDAVVALGVDVSFIETIHTMPGSTMDMVIPDPNKVVRDWRVAGALMEREDAFGAIMNAAGRLAERDNIGLLTALNIIIKDPRAIIEACVAALSTVADKQEE